MATELDVYRRRLDGTISDVESLQTLTTRVGYLVTAGKFAVGAMSKTEDTADKASTTVKVLGATLTVLGFVSPIKTPVKVMKTVLDKVEKPVDKLDDQFDRLDGKDDTSTPGKEEDGGFLKNVETSLTAADIAIAAVQDGLTLKHRQLEIAHEATGNMRDALAAAIATGEAWSGRYDALYDAVEAQLAARNNLVPDLEAFYGTVKDEVANFLSVLDRIDFEKIHAQFQGLEQIAGLFDFLEKPLEVAEGIIEPILPLLNAIDFVVGLIVNPIIEFVTETLGIADLIDSATDQIQALLPAIDLLDAFENLLQPLQDYLLEYIVDGLGSVEFLDRIEQTFFGDVVGEADRGPTGWGNDVSNVLTGDDGDDVLDALGGEDTIRGGAGDDVIVAGEGSDLLDGGEGADLFYFGASFTEYELSRDLESDSVVVSHVAPFDPEKNTGIDVLASLDADDMVVFTDISFTGEELNKAKMEGSVLNGDDEDNLLFLNSTGELKNGFHVANGFGGDDRIFGSTANDQLNGGDGNDLLVPGQGNDQANGDAGNDTFQVLEGARSPLSIDLLTGIAFGQGQDTLNSVENLVISPNLDHKIQANDAPNAIFTGDGIDVISGRGGDDTIESGGEDDYIVAGPGSDVVKAGADRDVIVSGSAAAADESDLYDGGDGFDVVSYTSNSNTIKFDINDQGDNPSILQKLKDYMEGQPQSGPVEIDAGAGEIRRFDMAGNHVSTDRAVNVEGFTGSDEADTLYGDVSVELLHGAAGDDTIHTGGSEDIFGGEGDDLILAEYVDGGPSTLQIDGGAGMDSLDLEGAGEARWYYKVESAIALTLRALPTTTTGDDLRNASGSLFELKPRSVEQISLGDHDDHAIYAPGGTVPASFLLMGGNDRFDGENGFADVDAGDGNDVGNFVRGGGGIFRGGAGDDYAAFDDTTRENRAIMGADRDAVRIERFFGHADGGDDFDSIAFDIAFNSRIVADLAAGTVESFKGISTINAEQVGMTLENFEEVIATEFADVVDGSDRDEQLLGRGGNDTLRGGDGRDKLFGGDGSDRLEGGDGEDLLHGGTGNDTLDGGAGNDAASYAWVRPGGIDGALIAEGFDGVVVSLATALATGPFGSDTLISIENVFGSAGADRLSGDEADNLLSGGDGDDTLDGDAGDDVLIAGRGTDTVSGGAGDDTLVAGIGDKTLDGGAGTDTLDFGTTAGRVTVDFAAGRYEATFVDQAPRWTKRDLDGDGQSESDGTETRTYDGQTVTPTMVRAADPRFATSAADLALRLPAESDPAYESLRIDLVDVDLASSGTFRGIERIAGGEAGTTLLLTDAVERFDGRVSGEDRIDFSDATGPLSYNLRTGEHDIARLEGDEMTGIDGLIGGSGDDSFTGDRGANLFVGGRGADALIGAGGKDELRGDGGADVLRGGGGRDEATGGGGKDTLLGNGGDDTLSGNRGKDALSGGNGDDSLSGDGGRDDLRGGRGDDALDGGKGNDALAGQGGDDRLHGGGGKDRLAGDGGDDRLYGEGSLDALDGGAGDDALTGGAGRDRIAGAKGSDSLAGGAGPDALNGGSGRDILAGGAGNDRLTGGGKADVFVFLSEGRAQTDTVTDFDIRHDTVLVDQSFDLRLIDGDVAVDLGGDEVLILEGVTEPEAVADRIVLDTETLKDFDNDAIHLDLG